MNFNLLKIFFLIIISFAINSFANDKTITMGYKIIPKMPLIGSEYDNSGLYFDLFSEAAKKIGYKLKIVRLPKKRLHLALELGVIDYYPGSSFSQKRANYLYYLANGLKTKEVLVSLNNRDTIVNIEDAIGSLIVERGSSKLEWDKIYPNLKINELNKLSMKTILHALKLKRGDFYIADIEIIDYYKKINNIKNYADIGIKIHENTINKEFIPMNLGFSRKSKLFSEKKNEYFNKNKTISIENFPTIIDKNSVAYHFFTALKELKEEEFTNTLYKKYFENME